MVQRWHSGKKQVQVLSPFFGGMISFVKDNEGYLERGEVSRINVNESKMLSELTTGSCEESSRTHPSNSKRIFKWLEKVIGSY